nr:MAG TPA: hypothetical protein [Caudoviricetes sp.]
MNFRSCFVFSRVRNPHCRIVFVVIRKQGNL